MLVWIASIASAICLLGCGSGTSADKAAVDDKNKLDANVVKLDPPPGTYAFKPWVVMTVTDDSIGSGSLYAKAPGSSEFKSAFLTCSGTPHSSGSATPPKGHCFEIKQSGTVTWYLENGDGRSDEKSVDYKFEPVQSAFTAELRSAADTAAETVVMQKRDAFCSYRSDDKLEVQVQTTLEKLGPERYAYVTLKINAPTAGQIAKFSAENSTEVGIEIRPTSDDLPIVTSPTYTTKPPSTLDVAYPAASCEVKVDTANRVGETKGTVTCSNLRSWKYEPEAGDELLGKLVSFSGPWQCETYKP